MKKIFDYKKPLFWIIIVALIACIVVGIVCLSGSKDEEEKTVEANNTNTDLKVYVEPEGPVNARIFADYDADPGKIIGLDYNELRKVYGNPTGSFCGFFGDLYVNENNEWLCVYYNGDTGIAETVQKKMMVLRDEEVGGYVYKCSDDYPKLILNGDSSFAYTQPSKNSNIYAGNWYTWGENMLVATENMQRNCFDIVDDTLVYRKGDSAGFAGYDVPDGTVFKRADSIPDKGHAYDQVVRYEDLDDGNYLNVWLIARSAYEIMLSSYHNMTGGPEARVSLALYLNGEFIIDLPKAGYAKAGTFTFDQDELVLTSKDGALKLAFDIPEETAPDMIVPQSKIRFNAERSTLQSSDIGLYDGMELEYYTTHSDVIIDGYSEVKGPVIDETDKDLDIYGKYYLTGQFHDVNSTFSISRYVDGKLVNRLSVMDLSISEMSLHEETINGEKHLFLTTSYTATAYAGKTFDYEVLMKNGLMVLARTDEKSPSFFVDRMITKWNRDAVLFGMD